MIARRVWAGSVVAVLAACSPTTSSQQQASVYVQGTLNFPATLNLSTSPQQSITINPLQTNVVDFISAFDTSQCPSSFQFTLPMTGMNTVVSNICNGGSGGNCTETTQMISAIFAPTGTTSTTVNCTLYITLDNQPPMQVCSNPYHLCVPLSGSAVEPAIDVRAKIKSIDFGSIAYGDTSSPVSVEVDNFGLGPATPDLMSAMVMRYPATFSISHLTTGSIASMGMTSFDVECAPGSGSGSQTEEFSDTLSLDFGTSNIDIALTCEGIQTDLGFNPPPLAPMQPTSPDPTGKCIRVGDTSTLSLELMNLGATPMPITSATFNDTEWKFTSGDPNGTMLGGSATTTAMVSYTPTATTDAVPLGLLTVVHDTANLTDKLGFSGCVTQPQINVTSQSLDFGPVCTNTTMPPMQTVTISSLPGPFQDSFQIVSVDQQLLSGTPFSLTGPATTGVTLVQPSSDGSTTVTVTAAPTQSGHSTSMFSFNTDIKVPADMQRQIALSVEGVEGGKVASTPSNGVNFGVVPLGQNSLAQPVLISNCTAMPANIQSAQITGKDAARFSIVIEPQGSSVDSMNVASYSLVFIPTRIGTATATLEIVTDTTTITLDLSGTGTNSGGETFGSATYYTCAVGSTAGWPIAVVVVFAMVRWRRRRRG